MAIDTESPTERTNVPFTLKQEGIRCSKENCRCRSGTPEHLHGPYWYAYRSSAGKTQKVYVGKYATREEAEQQAVRKISSPGEGTTARCAPADPGSRETLAEAEELFRKACAEKHAAEQRAEEARNEKEYAKKLRAEAQETLKQAKEERRRANEAFTAAKQAKDENWNSAAYEKYKNRRQRAHQWSVEQLEERKIAAKAAEKAWRAAHKRWLAGGKTPGSPEMASEERLYREYERASAEYVEAATWCNRCFRDELPPKSRQRTSRAERQTRSADPNVDGRLKVDLDLLGVDRSVDPAGLKRARDAAAMRYHPDRGGSDAMMAQVNAAYHRIKSALWGN